MLALTMSIHAQAHPPQILYVSRSFLKPLSPAAGRKLRKIEREAARACVRFKFPHAYLTLEPLTGPKEFWYFNAFDSQEEVKQLTDAFQKNAPLLAALNGFVQQRVPLQRAQPSNQFTRYRADLSRGAPWIVGRGRFLVITLTKGDPQGDGSVFEMEDGTRLVIRSAQTLAEAKKLAAAAGKGTNIYAARPAYCVPAKDWVAADPAFWRPRPGVY